MIWIKDAPICGVDSNETIEQFVDKHVTMNISLLPCRKKSGYLSNLLFITIDVLHKNIKTIKRSSITFSEIKKLSNIANRIFETFNNMEMGVNISFEDSLLMLNLDLLPYIDSSCNKLTMPTLFLKKI